MFLMIVKLKKNMNIYLRLIIKLMDFILILKNLKKKEK